MHEEKEGQEEKTRVTAFTNYSFIHLAHQIQLQ